MFDFVELKVDFVELTVDFTQLKVQVEAVRIGMGFLKRRASQMNRESLLTMS